MKRMMKGMALMAFLLAMAGCSTVASIITTPYDGQTVSGTITILVQPDASLFPDSVIFYIDGARYAEDAIPSGDSFSVEWDTTTYSYGSHKIKVEVTSGGSVVKTEEITVYVDNN